MEYQPQVQGNGKVGKAKGIWKRARTESTFTRFWFITFAISKLPFITPSRLELETNEPV